MFGELGVLMKEYAGRIRMSGGQVSARYLVDKTSRGALLFCLWQLPRHTSFEMCLDQSLYLQSHGGG